MFFLFMVLQYLSIMFPLLFAVAFLTLVERKGLSSLQLRRGPNTVSLEHCREFLEGFLQPFADAMKLLLKEMVIPVVSNKYLFFFAPLLSFLLSALGWVVIPFGDMFVMSDFYLGLLVMFAVSSFGVYAMILAGWASNSSYALLGALRSSAQMISYELGFGLILLCMGLCVGSLNMSDIVYFQEDMGWFFWSFMPLAFMFFMSVLAETNRVPFDLAEAEAELVSGYNVEYSSAGFVLFFIAEYLNMIFMSSLLVVFFFGGWTSPFLANMMFFLNPDCSVLWLGPYVFSFKLFMVIIFFMWVSGSLPSYSYDQLMVLGWKVLLPVSLAYFIVILVYLFLFM